MKKIISLILAMAMCLSLCVQTFAKENDGVNVENVPEMMGILRTDDGKEYTIKGVLVSVAPMSRAANDACSATYRYDLPVSPQANGSTTESDHDGAAASTVYLTIHYTHRNTPTEYLLTRVSGYWEISAQKVSVESAKLSYGCSGTFPSPTTQSVTDTTVKISDSGQAICQGRATLNAITNSASLTMKLQRSSNGSSWTTLKTWTATDTGTIFMEESWPVAPGYYYQTVVTAEAYTSSGSVAETVTASSAVVKY